MFDIGLSELLLAAIVGLIVLGPDRLPAVAGTLGRWIGNGKRMIASLKQQVENEVGLEELQQQLHESSVLKEIKDSKLGFTEIEVSDSEKTEPGDWPGMPPPGT